MKLIINNLVIIIVTINLNLCLISVCDRAFDDKYSLHNRRPKQRSESYVYSSSLTNEEPEYYDSNNSNEHIDDLGIIWDETGTKLVGGGKLVKIKENRQCKNNYIGLRQHPRNKQFYYICQRNRIVLGQCEDNKIFNDTYKCCVSQNHCAPNKVDQDDWKSKFNITHCYVPGIFPIQGQSRYYYKCVYLNGRFIQKIRKCPHGTLFDTTTGTCVERVKSSPNHIIPNQEDKFQLTTPVYTRPNHYETAIENAPCNSPGTYSADENSGYYYKCCLKSDGEYYQVKLKCPPGKSFDSTSKECIPNSDLDYYTDFPQPSIAKMIRHKKKTLFQNLPKMFTMQKRRMAKRIELLDDIFDNSDETKEETVKTPVNSKFCGCCDVNKYGDKFSSECESGLSYGSCIEYVENKESNSRRPKCNCTCHKTALTTPSTETSTLTSEMISTSISDSSSSASTTNSISNTNAPTTVPEKPSTSTTKEGTSYTTISTTTISPLTTTMETTISSETSTSTQDSIKASTPTIRTLTTPVSSLIADQYTTLITSTTYASNTSDTISTSEKTPTSSTPSTLQETTYTIETSPTSTNKTNPVAEIKITISNTELKTGKPKTNATSLMGELIANSINFNLVQPDILNLSTFEDPRTNQNSNHLENTTLSATVSEQEEIPNLEHVTTKTATALKLLLKAKPRKQTNALTKATFETTKITSESSNTSTNSDLPITKPMPTTVFPEATAMALISENESINLTTLSPSATFLTKASKNGEKMDESIAIPDLISNTIQETNHTPGKLEYTTTNTENQMIANEPNSSINDFYFTLSEDETTENETASAFMTYPEIPEITTSEDIAHYTNTKNSELNKQTNNHSNNEFDLEDFSEMNFNSTKAACFTSSHRTPPLRDEGSNDETSSDLSDNVNYNTYLTTNTPVYNTMPKVTDANFEFKSIESFGKVISTDKDSSQTVDKFNQNGIHSKQSAQNKHLLEITKSEIIGNCLSLNSDQDKLFDQMSSTVPDSTSSKLKENDIPDTNESTKKTIVRSKRKTVKKACAKKRLASKPSSQQGNKIQTGKSINKTVDLTHNNQMVCNQLSESDADASLEEEVSNLEIDEFQHSNYDELFNVPLPRCTCLMESIDNQSESASNSTANLNYLLNNFAHISKYLFQAKQAMNAAVAV